MPLRTLHFELWRCNRLDEYDPVDPIRYMRRWRQVGWHDSHIKNEPAARVA